MIGDLEKLTKLHLDIIENHIVFLDTDCKVIHMNKAAKKQFKIGRKGLIGNDCSSYCKFRDYNINDCTANIAKKTRKKQSAEIKIEDGSFYKIDVYPIIENEIIKGYIEISRDITKKKKAEEELIKSEEKYRTLIETMNEGLAIIDKNNVITFANLKLPEMLGLSFEELNGTKITDFYTEESHQVSRELTKRKREEYSDKFELSLRRKDGTIINVIVSPRPIYNDEDEFTGSLGVLTDITEMKRSEQELIKSENLYRTIFEATGTANALIDENNLIKLVNSKMEELTGYTKDELVGKTLKYRIAPEEILEKLIKPSIGRRNEQSQEQTVFESKMLDKKGNAHNILCYLSLIPGTKDTITSLLDITELKKGEDIRKMAYNQIINNIQEFANLIDGIRNPLNVIQGTIDLELDSWKDIIYTQIKKIESIAEQIDLRWAESEQFRNTLVEQLQ